MIYFVEQRYLIDISDDSTSDNSASDNNISSQKVSDYTIEWTSTVSFNGRKHMPSGTKKAVKDSKNICADMEVKVYDGSGNQIDSSLITAKVKNNKNAGEGSIVLKIKGKDFKEFNKTLKANPFTFQVNPADLSVNTPEVTLKNGKVKKVAVTFDGKSVKLSKKDYEAQTDSDGIVTINGKNNFTGTYTLSING